MRHLLALLLLCLFMNSSKMASAALTVSREMLVDRLKHYEGIVQTFRCEYTDIFLETPPAHAELIKRIKGKAASGFIGTHDISQKRSKSIILYQKGAKKRKEDKFLDAELANKGSSIMAYDGDMVRRVAYRPGGEPVASISSANVAGWGHMPINDPFAYAYQYYDMPYSVIIAAGSGFSLTSFEKDGRRFYNVLVTCARNGHILFFSFDDRFLVLERKVTIRNKAGRTFVNHKIIYSDYKAYPIPSGETVWFPSSFRKIGYNGQLPNGDPLEVQWEDFRVQKVEFNLDLSDKLFELEIPKTARINDRVTGLGWLPPSERPLALFPKEARIRRWWWTAGIVLTALIVVAAGVVYTRRKQRRALSGN